MTNLKDMDPISWLPAPPWGGLPPLFGAPWERQEQEETRVPSRTYQDPPEVSQAPPPSPPRPVPTGTPAYSGGGPGCRAADSCLLVHGYLVQLAEGKSGFGVLQIAKDRLEDGAAGAERMGSPELANRMREVASELSEVRTREQAATLAPRLKDPSDQTWELGRRCGGHR
jgi:hypothetical protein